MLTSTYLVTNEKHQPDKKKTKKNTRRKNECARERKCILKRRENSGERS